MPVQGVPELKSKLRQLVAGARENDSLKAGAELLAKSARSRAPRRTGRLRASGIQVSETPDGVIVGTGRVGRLQELGTRHMRPRPFLRPALEESRDAIVKAYGNEYKRVIDRVAGGGA